MSSTKKGFTNLSDTELLERIRTGHDIEQAMRFMYHAYYPGLESYVLANSGSSDDAADLMQELMVAFMELVQKDRFREESSIRTFLHSLTHNMWIDELRKRGIDIRYNDEFASNQEWIEEDYSQFMMYLDAQQTIVTLFDRISTVCRQILTLFYYENRSMKEIVEQTSYGNEQNVRNRKYKCLKELTDLLASSPVAFENVKTALQRIK
jgi:RNA polymerase sigma factor (sigma-70 family)